MNADEYRGRATETQLMQGILRAMNVHPAVAFAWRANTGGAEYAGRHVKFGFRGQSDILGVLKGSGRLVAFEVKRLGLKPTETQAAFLANVARAGGLSAVVHSPGEALQILDAQLRR